MKVDIVINYGKIKLNIEEHLKKSGISKNKLCTALDIPRSNFNRYCRNEFQRIDESIICKLCYYLDINPGELIEYIKPDPENEEKQEDTHS